MRPFQLTLFNFKSQFTTQYNLLFANILLVTIPALIMFIFFNRKIVEGMAAGSVKGLTAQRRLVRISHHIWC
jgi:raffinose/stachyose/melibiose transport system permease protein